MTREQAIILVEPLAEKGFTAYDCWQELTIGYSFSRDGLSSSLHYYVLRGELYDGTLRFITDYRDLKEGIL